MYRFATRWLGLGLGLLSGCLLASSVDAKPNILVVLCDDVGWGEIGFQGAKDTPTPHLDALAAGGLRFTQGYVSGPYCSPTRAGLLTGRYQTRFGHEFNSVARDSGLSLSEKTIADWLHEAGYDTCAVGKWHLGNGPEYRPMKRGFHEFYGTLANTPFFHPTAFVDSRLSPEVMRIADPDFYTTEQYARRVVDWLGQRPTNRPWFVYLPFNAQHAPLQAPEAYLDRFRAIEDPKRRTFAAMMAAMDDAVGQVMGKIRDRKEEENTLVFFLSDNGGPTQSTTSNNGPLRGFKATTWEGGVRVPFCVQWKGTLPAGKTYDHPVIQLDILPTCLAAAGITASSPQPLDGVNLLPYLQGQASGRPHETLYWRFGPQWAIRDGDLKLVVGRGGSGMPELYDLAADLGEAKDLAASRPADATRLRSKWDRWNEEQAPPSSPQERPANQKKKAKTKAKAKSQT